MEWQKYHWKELDKNTLYEIMVLRAAVFVVEQECAYLDPDGKDQEAMHVVVYDDQKLVGYSRIFLNKTPSVIGRVVVHPNYRGKNLGRLLMEKSISEVPAENPIFISAQERLKSFYESLGFLQSDKGYLEDGIPHIPMTLPLRRAKNL